MNRIMGLLDTIAQGDDSAVRQSIERLRQLLNGTMPSALFNQQANGEPQTIDDLRQQLAAEHARTEQLQQTLSTGTIGLDHGTYPLEVFLHRLFERRQIVYGWRIDYCKATQRTPNATRCTTTDIQSWQHKARVPAPFVDQIPWLIFPPRTMKKRGNQNN